MTTPRALLTNESLSELESAHQPPCLSLCQTTHRHRPESQQNPIRFRNLVKELRQTLQKTHSVDETNSLLEPFERLADDAAFWSHVLDGLAVFAAPGLFRILDLHRPVADLAVVADSFRTNSLRRLLQSADRYQILALSQREIQLFEGNRDSLSLVDLAPGVPRTLADALGEELTEPHPTIAYYGGSGAQGVAMYHGQGGRKTEAQIDEERFFRAIDRAILEHHSRPSGLPLLLVALAEHQGLFRQMSHNPFLMGEGLRTNPEALSPDELRERAWQVVEPQYQARLAALADEFALAKSRGLGLDDLAQVAAAAAAGRVAVLLVEADRQLPGEIVGATGEGDRREVPDLLDDLGALVLGKGGRVVVVPAEQMPTATGAAATCRF